MGNAGAHSWRYQKDGLYTSLGVAETGACVVATPARTDGTIFMFADDQTLDAATTSNGHAKVPGPAMDGRDFDVNLLALASVNGIGHKTLRRLVDHFGDLDRIWHEDRPIFR